MRDTAADDHRTARDPTPTRPVRVGVNLVFLPPGRISGTATYCWSLLTRLQHRSNLRLVLFTQGGHVPDEIDPDLVEIVACPRFGSINRRVLWEHTMWGWHARRRRLDVAWSPGFVSPRFTGCPRVVTVHDLFYVRVPAALPFVRRQYYAMGIPWSVRHCDAVLTVSANTADDLSREIPAAIDKVTVVHLAARPELIEARPAPVESSEPYFVVVASVTRNKNIDTVVRAAIAVRRANGHGRVRVVGEDPYGLLAEAMTLDGATEAVEVMGEVTDAELAGHYRGAVAAIMPSIYEGFGLPAVEAQALGTPLISSRGGSLPEVAGDAALYFDHDSVDQLVTAMTALLTDEHARADLADRGRRNASRFSWDRAAEDTAAVLEHVGHRH